MIGYEACLSLWDAAAARAPVDRAMLFAAQAVAEIPADLGLCARDAAVLATRSRLFGDAMTARVACPACDEPLDIALSAAALTEPVVLPDNLRAPTSRDLVDALALDRSDGSGIGRALARRLLAARAAGRDSVTDAEADLIEQRLEQAGAPGDITLGFVCPACGTPGTSGIDPTDWLWRELDAAATGVLTDVATLARAYGWTERDALALTPARRARYLALAWAGA